MEEGPIRVLLADDHALFRRGTRDLLEDDGGVVVVAEAADGEAALRLTMEHRPDVVVIDIRLPGLSGVEVTKRLKESDPSIPVLALNGHDDEHYIIEIFKSGGAGYLMKDDAEEEVVKAVKGAAEGRRGYMSQRVSEKVVDRFQASGKAARTYGELSDREIEVLGLLRQGCSNENIAMELHILVGTVKSHTTSLYRKLNVRSRHEAVAWAERHGVGRNAL